MIVFLSVKPWYNIDDGSPYTFDEKLVSPKIKCLLRDSRKISQSFSYNVL